MHYGNIRSYRPNKSYNPKYKGEKMETLVTQEKINSCNAEITKLIDQSDGGLIYVSLKSNGNVVLEWFPRLNILTVGKDYNYSKATKRNINNFCKELFPEIRILLSKKFKHGSCAQKIKKILKRNKGCLNIVLSPMNCRDTICKTIPFLMCKEDIMKEEEWEYLY